MKRSLGIGIGLVLCGSAIGVTARLSGQKEPHAVALPAATMFNVKVTKVQGNEVNVSVLPTHPEKDDVWGEIAAQYEGCSTVGKSYADPASTRNYVKFEGELTCPEFQPVKIGAYAVEPTDAMVGLPHTPAVGNTFTVVVLHNAQVKPKLSLIGQLRQLTKKFTG